MKSGTTTPTSDKGIYVDELIVPYTSQTLAEEMALLCHNLVYFGE